VRDLLHDWIDPFIEQEREYDHHEESRGVIGDSAASNPRLWSDDGQPFHNPVREGLPTIRSESLPVNCRIFGIYRAERLNGKSRR
jgi:hypothetical protein